MTVKIKDWGTGSLDNLFHNGFTCFNGIPETTQLNLTLVSSDTALDFNRVSNVGCISSVNWAMTLQSVLLKMEVNIVINLRLNLYY